MDITYDNFSLRPFISTDSSPKKTQPKVFFLYYVLENKYIS